MAVKIGHASIDENGRAQGGKAGDQTGKEVCTRNWYKHSKGWRVLRCTDPIKAGMIADAMRAAAENDKIGYDQGQRLTLYDQASKVGFDPGKVNVACETDCSALVRVCLAYAGITVGNFRTPTEADMLMATGMFQEMIGAAYTDSSDYLRVGDVLVTRTQGHTVVVLTDGPMAGEDAPVDAGYELGDRLLKKGCIGPDVQELQKALIALGYDCGSYGADGDFGSETEAALIKMQENNRLLADGIYGAESRAMVEKLLALLDNTPEPEPDAKPEPPEDGYSVTGGSVWLWTAPPGNGGQKAHTVHKGDALAKPDAGYVPIAKDGAIYWINAKYVQEVQNH